MHVCFILQLTIDIFLIFMLLIFLHIHLKRIINFLQVVRTVPNNFFLFGL